MGDTTLQLQYPPPPPQFRRFTSAAIAEASDPFLQPPPPLGPGVGAYTVFEDQQRLSDVAPKLSEMGIEQLFGDEDAPGFDRAAELKLLNHSLLLNFLELQHVLVHRPEEVQFSLLARDTLKLLMELQIKRRQNMAKDLETCLKDIRDAFRDFETSFANTTAKIEAESESIPMSVDEKKEIDTVMTEASIKTTSTTADDMSADESKYWAKKQKLGRYAASLTQ
ncbi:Mediator of RNA polymerase II transcription subunit 7 [Rhizoclosmatium sp. JEL0117]|nr:Mediator of RNA polymerase II transcription subunit 7 [Rhizoclosmatium sp. JEL0117]